MNPNEAVLNVLPPPFEWCEIPGNTAFDIVLNIIEATNEINRRTFAIEPFLMAKYPITSEQFQVFVDDPQGFHNAEWWQELHARTWYQLPPGTPDFTHAKNLPCENVSWWEAMAFCQWLNARLGLPLIPGSLTLETLPGYIETLRGYIGIRLPTEWEWQWAAQGPDGREYPYGNEFDAHKANTSETGIRQPTPVDSYPQGASPFGVLDMSGNAYDWCLTKYVDYENLDLGSAAERVVRGGSWTDNRRRTRCSFRNFCSQDPGFRGDLFSFRVVCGLFPSSERRTISSRRINKSWNITVTKKDQVLRLKDFLSPDNHLDFEPQMIVVPEGEFLMGTSDKEINWLVKNTDWAQECVEQERFDREQAQHSLWLADYAIGRFPVTNLQYQAFVVAAGYRPPEHWNGPKSPEAIRDHPVVLVTYEDAVAYCAWLVQSTGKPYRLPSEAEWEKAARGTDGRQYPWGNSFNLSLCNTREGGPGTTTPVGQYSPTSDSPYGCADMAGNVHEWTLSLWGTDNAKPDFGYPYQVDDGRENTSADSHVLRVARGGAWLFGQDFARCTLRSCLGPNISGYAFGFRVVIAPPISLGS